MGEKSKKNTMIKNKKTNTKRNYKKTNKKRITKRIIKNTKSTNKKTLTKKQLKNKNKFSKGGSSCSVSLGTDSTPCFQVDAWKQYKSPCSFLPLDGPNQLTNIYSKK